MSTSETFIAHLIELRTRLLNSVIACWWHSSACSVGIRSLRIAGTALLAKLPKGGQMIATDVTTPFFVPLKVAMMAAFLIVLPYILYQIWRFVAPGLYAHEKRMVVPLIVASTLLFFCGMSFAYLWCFPWCSVLSLPPHRRCGGDDRHR